MTTDFNQISMRVDILSLTFQRRGLKLEELLNCRPPLPALSYFAPNDIPLPVITAHGNQILPTSGETQYPLPLATSDNWGRQQ